MSLRQLHTPQDIVDQAGTLETFMASLEPAGQKIYVRGNSSSDRDCYAAMNLLKSGCINQWFSTSSTLDGALQAKTEAADARAEVPQVHLGVGLRQKDVPEQESSTNGNVLNYVLLLQGRNGGNLRKILVCQGVHEVGETIVCEALNGFSTVFSAAIASAAGNLITRLASRDPEGLLKTLTFTRVSIGSETHRVSKRHGWESYPTQMRDMKQGTNVDVEKSPLKVGFIN